jgi:hypothetical protein
MTTAVSPAEPALNVEPPKTARPTPLREAEGATALGGGIYALNSAVDIENSTIKGNDADGSLDGEGGGIYAYGGIFTLVNTTVKGNKASTGSDDIFLHS